MLKMPVTDILVGDLGMMGQAHCTVGLMCTPKCLQSSIALTNNSDKNLIFSFNHFYRLLINTLQNLGFIKHTPTVCTTTTYIGSTKRCNWLQVLSSSESANRASDSHLLKLTDISQYCKIAQVQLTSVLYLVCRRIIS